MTSAETFALPSLAEILARWKELAWEQKRAEFDWQASHGYKASDDDLKASKSLIGRMAASAEGYMAAFLQDNSHLSAEQLDELSGHLSPGGAHTGGLFVRLVHANRWDADPLLVAATVWQNWHGGKFGFQFLPDAARTPDDDYQDEVTDLHELIGLATSGDPRRLLTGADLAFFDSLPDRFTVYRGCPGLSVKKAGMGLCWTTRRDIAEWFARRGENPIVLTARIQKTQVLLAKASEFEVVCSPLRSRPLKGRMHNNERWRPEMEWRQPA